MTCHDQDGTAPASPPQSDTSSTETQASAGSANTPKPTPSTTSNPPAPDQTSNGHLATGEQHTWPALATPKAAQSTDAPAPATPDDEHDHPNNHPPANGDCPTCGHVWWMHNHAGCWKAPCACTEPAPPDVDEAEHGQHEHDLAGCLDCDCPTTPASSRVPCTCPDNVLSDVR